MGIYDSYFGNQDSIVDEPYKEIEDEEVDYSTSSKYDLFYEDEGVIEDEPVVEESLTETKPVEEVEEVQETDFSFEEAVVSEQQQESVSEPTEVPVSTLDGLPTIDTETPLEGISQGSATRSTEVLSPLPIQTEEGVKRIKDDLGSGYELASDLVIALAQGASAVPQAWMGLMDIPLGGRIGLLLEGAGYKPKEINESLSELKSDRFKSAEKQFSGTESFSEAFAAVMDRPELAGDAIAQSIPSMLGGQLLAKGLLKLTPKLAPWLAGAMGEGLMASGSKQEEFRTESSTGRTSLKEGAGALGVGVGTAMIGASFGKFAKTKGFSDFDDFLIAKAPGANTTSLASRVAAGVTSETFEELGQTAQEVIITNAIKGDPLTKGLDKASVMAITSAGPMGGMAQFRHKAKTSKTLTDAPTQEDADNILKEVGITTREGGEPSNIYDRIDSYTALTESWDEQLTESDTYKKAANDPDVIAGKKTQAARAEEFRLEEKALEETPVELPPKTQERYEEKRLQEQAKVDKVKSEKGKALVDKLKAQGVSVKSAEESAAVFEETGMLTDADNAVADFEARKAAITKQVQDKELLATTKGQEAVAYLTGKEISAKSAEESAKVFDDTKPLVIKSAKESAKSLVSQRETRDKPETMEITNKINELQDSMKVEGYSDKKAEELGVLLKQRDALRGTSKAAQTVFKGKEGPTTKVAPKVTKEAPKPVKGKVWVHDESGRAITKIEAGENKGQFRVDGVSKTFDNVATAMSYINKKEGTITSDIQKTEKTGFTSVGQVTETSKSTEDIIIDKVTPTAIPTPKTRKKTKRRVVTSKKDTLRKEQLHKLSNTISPKDKTSRQNNLVSAILVDDQKNISAILESYPKGDRNAVLRASVALAQKEAKDTGDFSSDTIIETADIALGSIQGKKLLAGNFEMKSSDIPGMFTGTNPDTGTVWKIFKTGAKEFTVMKGKQTIDIIKGDRYKALEVVKEGVKAETPYTTKSLKGDPSLDFDTYHNVVLDSKGNIVPGPDRQGFKYMKEAVAFASTLSQGKEVVAKKAASPTKPAKESETNLRQTREKKERKPEVKIIEKTSELEKEILERQKKSRKEEKGLRDMRDYQEKESENNRKKLINDYNKTVEDFSSVKSSEMTDYVVEVKDLATVLRDVIDKSSDDNANVVGELLLRAVPKEKLEAVTFAPSISSKAYPSKKGSWYDSRDNTIYYQPGVSPRTVVHEAIHGITMREWIALDKSDPLYKQLTSTYVSFNEFVEQESLLTSEQLDEASKGSKSDQKKARAKYDIDDQAVMYALSNPFEFLSMVLTNPYVTDIAKQVKVPSKSGKKKITAWQAIKDFTMAVIGVPKQYYSAFESLLDITTDLSQMQVVNNNISHAVIADNFDSEFARIEDRTIAKDGFVKTKKTAVLDAVKKVWKEGLQGIDEALGEIHPDLKAKFRAYNSASEIKSLRRSKRLVPFDDSVKEMSLKDKNKLAFLLNNYHDEGARKQLDKFLGDRAELKAAWGDVKKVLSEITKEMADVGIIPKSREFYFPTKVKDFAGLMESMEKDGRSANNLLYEVKQGLGYPEKATDVKKQAWEKKNKHKIEDAMQNMLSRGVYPAMLRTPGSSKKKTIWDKTLEQNDFYYNPVDTLMLHIHDSTESIEQRNLVGASSLGKLESKLNDILDVKKPTARELDKIKELKTDIANLGDEMEGNIGAWISERAIEGLVSGSDQRLVRDLLHAKFNEKGLPHFIADIKMIGTGFVLSQVTSVLSQIPDITTSIAEWGYRNTLSATYRIATGNGLYTRDDITAGSQIKDVGESENIKKFAETVMFFFGQTDKFFKNISMEAARLSAKGMTQAEFNRKFGKIYDKKGESTQLWNDLQDDKKNYNTDRFFWNELAEVQPMSTGQMPAFYAKGGAWRLMYSLRSFSVKIMNNMRKNYVNASRDGFMGLKGAAAGTAALVHYVAILVAMGASVGCAQAMVLGRECDMPDEVLDNTLRLFFMSRYATEQIGEGRIDQVIGSYFVPPLGWINKPLSDVVNLFTEESPTWKSMTEFPIVGRVLWERTSKEALKKKASKKRKRIFALNKEISTEGGSSADRRELRELRNEYNREIRELGLDVKKVTSGSLRRSTQRMKRQERRKKKNTTSSSSGSFLSSVGKAVESAAGVLSPSSAYAGEAPEKFKVDRKAASQKAVLIGNSAKRLGVKYKTAKENLDKFTRFVGMVENDGKLVGNNPTSTAEGLYQFIEGSIEPAINRLKRHIGYQEWMKEVVKTKDVNKLTREQQTLMFLADLLEKGGSDRTMKKVMEGDLNAFKEAYKIFHHTNPDVATLKRIDKLIKKVL